MTAGLLPGRSLSKPGPEEGTAHSDRDDDPAYPTAEACPQPLWPGVLLLQGSRWPVPAARGAGVAHLTVPV